MSKSPEDSTRIPDEDDTAEVPLTMAASVILTNLPRDASKALESAGDLGLQKSKAAEHMPETLLRGLFGSKCYLILCLNFYNDH